ncbi:MAG: aminoglycoside phosphotransferase family protein [Firmicutes bacterium]|nr:aminoglycoside phosphotransferase family protein [Bacillota bacterium]
MENKILDIDLEKDIKRLNLEVVKVIFKNEKKQRYTILVKQGDELNILKWNNFNEENHLDLLKKEIMFYKEYQSEIFLPRLRLSESNLLLIEYIKGKTLRSSIIYYISCLKGQDHITQDFEILIANLISTLKSFYSLEENNNLYDKETSKRISDYFNSLLISGPMDSSKILERNILRIIRRLLSRIINKKIQLYCKQLEENDISFNSKVFHGDFHLNNLLISDGGMKIIDWENYDKGPLFIDISYCYAMIMFLLRDLPKHQELVKNKFNAFLCEYDPHLKKSFQDINRLFYLAISVNRSFGHQVPISYFLKKIFIFPFKLINYSI